MNCPMFNEKEREILEEIDNEIKSLIAMITAMFADKGVVGSD